MNKKMLKVLLTTAMTASMAIGSISVQPQEVQAAASTYTGTHFDDGFDYYDTSKWHKAVDYTNGDMFYCTWRDANVAFNDGKMEMKILSDNWQSEYSRYSGGEYRSNQAFHYGMYQVNMKPVRNDGVVTSFFTYTGPSDGTNWDEIDIEFLGKDTTKVQFNYYTNGVGGHEYVYNLGFDASQGFHTYGFYWASDYIAWYVDGNEVYRTPASQASIIPDEPSRIMMNVWPGKGVDDWLNPFNGVTPLTASYDWMAWDAPGTSGESSDNNSSSNNSSSTQFQAGKQYKIISRNSGKALDVEWGNTADGTNILQYTYCGYPNQKWYLESTGDGYYVLRNVATGKVVDVSGNSKSSGANIHQWYDNGGYNQQWKIEPTEDGCYKLTARSSGKCIDVSGGSTADNANVHQWDYAGGYNQQWRIEIAE